VGVRAVLAQLQRRAELVKAGVFTPQEDAASRHGAASIETNLNACRDHLRLKGSTEHWYTRSRRSRPRRQNSRFLRGLSTKSRRCHPVTSAADKAGEEDRTPDIQLGKIKSPAWSDNPGRPREYKGPRQHDEFHATDAGRLGLAFVVLMIVD
jgi:hypothetical protein